MATNRFARRMAGNEGRIKNQGDGELNDQKPKVGRADGIGGGGTAGEGSGGEVLFDSFFGK